VIEAGQAGPALGYSSPARTSVHNPRTR
jgi:hypothetical protein